MYDWRFGDDTVSQLWTNKPLAKTTLKLMLAFYRGSASYLLLFSMKGRDYCRFYCSFSFYLTAMKCRQTFTVWDFELIPFSTMTDLQSEPSCDFSCATECLPDLWRTREPKSSQTQTLLCFVCAWPWQQRSDIHHPPLKGWMTASCLHPNQSQVRDFFALPTTALKTKRLIGCLPVRFWIKVVLSLPRQTPDQRFLVIQWSCDVSWVYLFLLLILHPLSWAVDSRHFCRKRDNGNQILLSQTWPR